MQKSKDGQPALTDDQWRYIWSCAEQQGLGAVRSQGHGRFEVIEWEPVKVSDLPDTGSVAKSVEEALLADTAVKARGEWIELPPSTPLTMTTHSCPLLTFPLRLDETTLTTP